MPTLSGRPLAGPPLSGRVVLVVGAGSALGTEIARFAAALGAAVVVADRDVAAAVRTAGLVASAASVVRVVEAPCPPLLGEGLLAATRAVLGEPTDVVLVTGGPGPTAQDASALAAGGRRVVLAGPVEGGDRRAQVRARASEVVHGLVGSPS